VPKEWHETKSLLLAAEVVSPSNARDDRVTKRRFSMRVAVAEYSVVDTDARIIERNRAGVEGVEILDRTLTWTPGQRRSISAIHVVF
jgi:Uma2 family endonuclease